MAIEAIGPEVVRPLNLFPIGRDAVLRAINPILMEPNQSWADYLALEEPLLELQNPYAYAFLAQIAEDLSGINKKHFRIGTAVMYEILKTKAGTSQLPILSFEFVQTHVYQTGMRLDRLYGVSPEVMIAGQEKEETIREGIFAMTEGEAYLALNEKLPAVGNDLSDSALVSSLITSYFLYKKGFEDSSNWEQS